MSESVFPNTCAMEQQDEIKQRNRESIQDETSEYGTSRQPNFSLGLLLPPGLLIPEVVDELPNKLNLHLQSISNLLRKFLS